MLPLYFVIVACNRAMVSAPIEGPVAEDIAALEEAPGEPAPAPVIGEATAPGSAAIGAARARHLARAFSVSVEALAVPPAGPPGDHRAEERALYALADALNALYGDTHLGRGAAWDVLRYARQLEASPGAGPENAALLESALRSAVAAVQADVAERPELAEQAAEAEWATEAIRADRSLASQRRTILRALRSLSDVMLETAEAPEGFVPQLPGEPAPGEEPTRG